MYILVPHSEDKFQQYKAHKHVLVCQKQIYTYTQSHTWQAIHVYRHDIYATLLALNFSTQKWQQN